MSSRGREGLYKKGKTRGVDVRVKDKRLEAKKKRDEVLSNRRGVLTDVNHEEGENKLNDTVKISNKHLERVNKRKEDLIKWKQERDERKRKEKLTSKPIFLPSGSFKPDTTSSTSLHPLNTTITTTKATSIIASNIDTCNTTRVETRVLRKSSRIANSTRSSQKDDKQKSLPSLKVSKSINKGTVTTTKGVMAKKKVAKPVPTTTSSKSHDDHMTRQATQSSVDDNKGLTSRSRVTIVKEKENLINNNPTYIHNKDMSHVFTAAWIPGATVATPSKGGVAPDFERAFVNDCFSPFQFGKSESKSKFTFRKELQPFVKSELLYDSIEEGVVSTPVTMKGQEDKGHEEEEEEGQYYNGHSDDSIEAINVSVAHNNDYTNQLQEESSNKMETDTCTTNNVLVQPSLLSSDGTSDNFTSPEMKDTPLLPPTVTPTSGSSSEYITPPTHIDLPINVASPDFIIPPINNTEVTSTTVDKGHDELSTNSLKDDLRPFYQQHKEVTTRFNDLCREWNEKLEQLEEQDIRPTDEVIDDIRTTVCQAQLLMRQKLKQYIDLVKLAEDPTAEQRSNTEDLQGFWDMVYFQVENIDAKFNLFKEMEANNWTAPLTIAATVTKTKPRRSKRRASEVAKSKLSKTAPPPSERQLAARAKREAARSKLRALKMAAREKEENEDQGPPAPKTPKQDDNNAVDLISFSPAIPPSSPPLSSSLPPPGSNGYKTPKTRSSRKKQKDKTPRGQTEEIPLNEVEEMQGAFVTKLVQINSTSKKSLSKLDTLPIMSPARRSKRLLDQQQLVPADSLLDMPTKYQQDNRQDNNN